MGRVNNVGLKSRKVSDKVSKSWGEGRTRYREQR